MASIKAGMTRLRDGSTCDGPLNSSPQGRILRLLPTVTAGFGPFADGSFPYNASYPEGPARNEQDFNSDSD
jgi:hypothetical protein